LGGLGPAATGPGRRRRGCSQRTSRHASIASLHPTTPANGVR
jgi:hypothetical protein